MYLIEYINGGAIVLPSLPETDAEYRSLEVADDYLIPPNKWIHIDEENGKIIEIDAPDISSVSVSNFEQVVSDAISEI